MAETPRDKVWMRWHANRQITMVARTPVAEERYSYGVAQPIFFPDHASDFSAAKRLADEKSNCPQPCGCPDWLD